MKKYELTQYELVKVRVDHKPIRTLVAMAFFSTALLINAYVTNKALVFQH